MAFIYFTGRDKKFVERMVGQSSLRFPSFVPIGVPESTADFFCKNYRFDRVKGDPAKFAVKNDTWKKALIVVSVNKSMGDTLLTFPAIEAWSKKYPWFRIMVSGHPRNAGLAHGLKFIDEYQSLWEYEPRRSIWYPVKEFTLRDQAENHPKRKEMHRADIYALVMGVPLNGSKIQLQPREEKVAKFELPWNKYEHWVIVQLRSVSPLRSWDWDWPKTRSFRKATELINRLTKLDRVAVIIIDAEEFPIHGHKIYNLTGKTKEAEELAALTAKCKLAICCGDSGLVHIAGMQEIPWIGIYGPIDSKNRTKYYTKGHGFIKKNPCVNCIEMTVPNCKRQCMEISVDEVYKKAVKLGGLIAQGGGEQCHSTPETKRRSSSEISTSTSTRTQSPRRTPGRKSRSASRQSSQSFSKVSPKY